MVAGEPHGRRVYITNSLYGAWDDQFYPNGVGAWMAKIDADPAGGMSVDERFFLQGNDFLPRPARAPGPAAGRRRVVGLVLLPLTAVLPPPARSRACALPGRRHSRSQQRPDQQAGPGSRPAPRPGPRRRRRRRSRVYPPPDDPRHTQAGDRHAHEHGGHRRQRRDRQGRAHLGHVVEHREHRRVAPVPAARREQHAPPRSPTAASTSASTSGSISRSPRLRISKGVAVPRTSRRDDSSRNRKSARPGVASRR